MSQIRTGTYAPGERLTEERVAGDLGVSRTPVREAISQLCRNGLLSARNRGGYEVPSLTAAELVEIFEVRKLVEPHGVLLAAREYGKKEIRAIDKAIKDQADSVSAQSPNKFARGNEDFRKALFDGISNQALVGIITQFGYHLQVIRTNTLKDKSLRKEIVRRQKEIRNAIAKGDEVSASELWVDYLSFSESTLVAAMK